MMKVLIIEDSQEKLEAIAAVLSALEYEYVATREIANTYQLLDDVNYSGIVLDMTFQARRGSDSQLDLASLAGVEILQFLWKMELDIPVIVATQHSFFRDRRLPAISSIEELDKLLVECFPSNYRGIVRVDLGAEEWKVVMGSLIRRHFRASAA